MREMTAIEFFDYFDFTIYKSTNCDGDICYKLKDNQRVNLGDIESDCFMDLSQAVDRLDIYYNDYIIGDLKEIHPELMDFEWSNYEQLYNNIKDRQEKDLDYHKTLLYYILNPEQIIDNVKNLQEAM